MDKNNIEVNNPISNLTFLWTAKFKDSEDICQFDFETGKEHRFQEVIDRFNNLEYFILWNKEKVFTVDLINGLIYFNTELKEKIGNIEKKENIRLVFFRRHKIEIGTQDLEEKNHIIEYYLGLQWNNKLGNNQKIILKIDESGNFVIGE